VAGDSPTEETPAEEPAVTAETSLADGTVTSEGAVTGPRALAVVYLKGVAMGAADTVPGVSGGTIALIVGIYERLIRALTALDPAILAQVPRLHRRTARAALWEDLHRMDAFFLLALGVGVVTSVVSVSRVVYRASQVFEPQTFAFFFGLIGASGVVLSDQLSVRTPGRAGAAVLGFGVAFLLAGVSSSGAVGHALPVVFVSGAIAITAMVLPGVSGAFILLLLGQYTFLTGTLTRFVDGLLVAATGGPNEGLAAGAAVVGAFVAGALVGVLTVAHLIRRALDRYRAATLTFLVSLMVGSLRLPVERVLGSVGVWSATSAASVVGAAAVGAGAVLLLDRYTDDLEYAR